uniref:F-box/kelch-repeat protein At3g23880-like n=1 Tax=Erigeron canadensis TaxID=72917 RepID=UPI001CB9A862|nr:F-box/kelch-repeat protein At3g23880-like [Erigeron canadensis]
MTLEQAEKMVESVPLPKAKDDIILEILLRFPVKSLLRCKSVCKSWRSLISNPLFIKSHLKLSSTNIAHHRLIFTYNKEKNLRTCPLDDIVFEKSVVNSLDQVCPSDGRWKSGYAFPLKIIGSCNGLVCIVFFRSEGNILFIWNPSTKISTRLYSTFDMSPPPAGKENVVYGFAYDKATDDYKIVAVSLCDQNKVIMYSLKTRNWKQIGDFPNGYPVNMSGVFSNGFLHWMATPTPREYNEPIYLCTIVSLDLDNKTHGEVSQPMYDEDGKVGTLGALGEWLCVLCDYRVTCADLWVMKVYGVEDSWTRLASITYPADISSPYYDWPLFIGKDGTILLHSGWNLVVCNTNDGSFSNIKKFGRCTTNATIFVESLVSPYPQNSPGSTFCSL